MSFFKNVSIPVFNQLSVLFSSKLSFVLEKSALQIYKATLSEFLPTEQMLKVPEGHDKRESDFGYLFMCDVKGSTKLSTLVGSEKYLLAAENLSKKLAVLLGAYGWIMRDFEWDAFYFTKTSSDCVSSDQHLLDEVLYKIEDMFLSWQKEFFSGDVLSKMDNAIGFRVCICFGDISRGLTSGANKRWAIIGNSIAVISKLESKVKKEKGLCFVVEDTYIDQSKWIDNGIILESVNKKILTYYQDYKILRNAA